MSSQTSRPRGTHRSLRNLPDGCNPALPGARRPSGRPSSSPGRAASPPGARTSARIRRACRRAGTARARRTRWRPCGGRRAARRWCCPGPAVTTSSPMRNVSSPSRTWNVSSKSWWCSGGPSQARGSVISTTPIAGSPASRTRDVSVSWCDMGTSGHSLVVSGSARTISRAIAASGAATRKTVWTASMTSARSAGPVPTRAAKIAPSAAAPIAPPSAAQERGRAHRDAEPAAVDAVLHRDGQHLARHAEAEAEDGQADRRRHLRRVGRRRSPAGRARRS